jgi:glycine/D-amino acid oxidase-like deaminating enzyme/nitrite reductase/ring-hydroxylating ferredoxin subunit
LTLPGRAISAWLDTPEGVQRPPLAADVTADVAVIGGGLAGLSTAYELRQDGADVVVLEGRTVASGVSGNTTAKLSALHGLVSSHGLETARAYAGMNQWGVERVRDLAAELGIDCDLDVRPNFTYTEDPERHGDLVAEVDAASAAGLEVSLAESTEVPGAVAAVRCEDQAQFHPVKYLRGLANALAEGGAAVHEHTRALGVGDGAVTTDAGHRVRAGRVVVATQIPFLDRGLFFARASVERSYAITVAVEGPLPDGMYLQAESPGRTLRTIPWRDETLLMVGGESHSLGHGDPVPCFEALERYARDRFEVTRIEHRWDAHDFMPDDGLPYIGRLTPFSDDVLVITGGKKWGLAMGVGAGRALAHRIAGRESEWASAFDPWRRPKPSSVKTWAELGADTALHLVADRLKRTGSAADLAPGEGRVVGSGLGQEAVHRDDDGQLHAVSARCTHLGCIVEWNAAERTWDCPCHGSRFGAKGEVLTGPATHPLEKREAPADR